MDIHVPISFRYIEATIRQIKSKCSFDIRFAVSISGCLAKTEIALYNFFISREVFRFFCGFQKIFLNKLSPAGSQVTEYQQFCSRILLIFLDHEPGKDPWQSPSIINTAHFQVHSWHYTLLGYSPYKELIPDIS